MIEAVEEQPLDIVADDRRLEGVWANDFEVVPGVHEFTLDFYRLDHSSVPPRIGVLVARVALSSLMLSELREELDRQWESYTRRALPREVYGEDDPA